MRTSVFLILLLLAIDGHSQSAPMETSASIIVDAPVGAVWSYVSDSSRAVEWSVYFDHISVLSGTDGVPGTIRRCFRNMNEKGIFWDETILASEVDKSRKLSVENIHGFFPPFANDFHFLAMQNYQTLAPGQTRLTFTMLLEGNPHLAQEAMLVPSLALTRKIFVENLKNIKAAVEEKQNYQRVFPWQANLDIVVDRASLDVPHEVAPHCLPGDVTHKNIFVFYDEKEKYERKLTGVVSDLACGVPGAVDLAWLKNQLPLTGKRSVLEKLDLTDVQKKYLEQIRLGALELREETTAAEYLAKHPIDQYTKDLNRVLTQKFGYGFAGEVFRAWVESQPQNISVRNLIMANMELLASPKNTKSAQDTSQVLAHLFDRSIILVSLGLGWDNIVQPDTPDYVKAFLENVQSLGLPVKILTRAPYGYIEDNAREITPQIVSTFKNYDHVYFLTTCKGSPEALLALTQIMGNELSDDVVKSKFSGFLSLSGQYGPVYIADSFSTLTHSKIVDWISSLNTPKSWQPIEGYLHALTGMDTPSMTRIQVDFLRNLPENVPYLNVVGVLGGNGLLKHDSTAMAPIFKMNRKLHLARGANDGFLEYPDNILVSPNLRKNYVVVAEGSHMLVEGQIGPYSLLDQKNDRAVFKALLKTLAELSR